MGDCKPETLVRPRLYSVKFNWVTGIIVFAHGSRIESANEAVRKVASDLAVAGQYPAVITAFLELGEPDLPAAVESMAARGVDKITVIPYFLALGLHMERDLPRLIDAIVLAHPGLDIGVTPPLDGHPALVEVLLDRARGPRNLLCLKSNSDA